MAMNSSTLSTAIASRLKSLWRNDPPANQTQNQDYFLDELAKAIAEEVVNHIVGNAQCNGVDSNGDSHGTVGIV